MSRPRRERRIGETSNAVWEVIRGGQSRSALGYNTDVPPPLFQASCPGTPDLTRPAVHTNREMSMALLRAARRTFPIPTVDKTVEVHRVPPFRTAFSGTLSSMQPPPLPQKSNDDQSSQASQPAVLPFVAFGPFPQAKYEPRPLGAKPPLSKNEIALMQRPRSEPFYERMSKKWAVLDAQVFSKDRNKADAVKKVQKQRVENRKNREIMSTTERKHRSQILAEWGQGLAAMTVEENALRSNIREKEIAEAQTKDEHDKELALRLQRQQALEQLLARQKSVREKAEWIVEKGRIKIIRSEQKIRTKFGQLESEGLARAKRRTAIRLQLENEAAEAVQSPTIKDGSLPDDAGTSPLAIRPHPTSPYFDQDEGVLSPKVPEPILGESSIRSPLAIEPNLITDFRDIIQDLEGERARPTAPRLLPSSPSQLVEWNASPEIDNHTLPIQPPPTQHRCSSECISHTLKLLGIEADHVLPLPEKDCFEPHSCYLFPSAFILDFSTSSRQDVALALSTISKHSLTQQGELGVCILEQIAVEKKSGHSLLQCALSQQIRLHFESKCTEVHGDLHAIDILRRASAQKLEFPNTGSCFWRVEARVVDGTCSTQERLIWRGREGLIVSFDAMSLPEVQEAIREIRLQFNESVRLDSVSSVELSILHRGNLGNNFVRVSNHLVSIRLLSPLIRRSNIRVERCDIAHFDDIRNIAASSLSVYRHSTLQLNTADLSVVVDSFPAESWLFSPTHSLKFIPDTLETKIQFNNASIATISEQATSLLIRFQIPKHLKPFVVIEEVLQSIGRSLFSVSLPPAEPPLIPSTQILFTVSLRTEQMASTVVIPWEIINSSSIGALSLTCSKEFLSYRASNFMRYPHQLRQASALGRFLPFGDPESGEPTVFFKPCTNLFFPGTIIAAGAAPMDRTKVSPFIDSFTFYDPTEELILVVEQTPGSHESFCGHIFHKLLKTRVAELLAKDENKSVFVENLPFAFCEKTSTIGIKLLTELQGTAVANLVRCIAFGATLRDDTPEISECDYRVDLLVAGANVFTHSSTEHFPSTLFSAVPVRIFPPLLRAPKLGSLDDCAPNFVVPVGSFKNFKNFELSHHKRPAAKRIEVQCFFERVEAQQGSQSSLPPFIDLPSEHFKSYFAPTAIGGQLQPYILLPGMPLVWSDFPASEVFLCCRHCRQKIGSASAIESETAEISGVTFELIESEEMVLGDQESCQHQSSAERLKLLFDSLGLLALPCPRLIQRHTVLIRDVARKSLPWGHADYAQFEITPVDSNVVPIAEERRIAALTPSIELPASFSIPPQFILPNTARNFRQGTHAASLGFPLMPDARVHCPLPNEGGKHIQSCEICVELTGGGFGDRMDRIEWLTPSRQKELYRVRKIVDATCARGIISVSPSEIPVFGLWHEYGPAHVVIFLSSDEAKLISSRGRQLDGSDQVSDQNDENEVETSSQSDGILLESPSLPPEAITAVLRAIAYKNDDSKLKAGQRIFTIRVLITISDGKNTLTDVYKSKVTVKAHPAMISVPHYAEKVSTTSCTAVPVAPKLTVGALDMSSPLCVEGVFVSVVSGGCGEDRLVVFPPSEKALEGCELVPTAKGSSSFSIISTDPVSFGSIDEWSCDEGDDIRQLSLPAGSIIGSVVPTSNLCLTINFTFPPPAKLLQSVLRGIAYENSGAIMSGQTRVVDFSAMIRDGSISVVSVAVNVRVPDLPPSIDLDEEGKASALPLRYHLGEGVLLLAPSITLTSCQTASDQHPVLRVEFMQAPSAGDMLWIAPTHPLPKDPRSKESSVAVDEVTGAISVDGEVCAALIRRAKGTDPCLPDGAFSTIFVSFHVDATLRQITSILRRIAFRVNLDATTTRRALRQRQKKVQLSFKPKGKLWTRISIGILIAE